MAKKKTRTESQTVILQYKQCTSSVDLHVGDKFMRLDNGHLVCKDREQAESVMKLNPRFHEVKTDAPHNIKTPKTVASIKADVEEKDEPEGEGTPGNYCIWSKAVLYGGPDKVSKLVKAGKVHVKMVPGPGGKKRKMYNETELKAAYGVHEDK